MVADLVVVYYRLNKRALLAYTHGTAVTYPTATPTDAALSWFGSLRSGTSARHWTFDHFHSLIPLFAPPCESLLGVLWK